MTNYWDTPGIPHKGWNLVDVIDLQEEGGGFATAYERCMMCNHENIRFVHILEHPRILEPVRVGCVCAEKMTEDYKIHREKETYLKNKSIRKAKWLTKKWGKNNLGGLYCTKNGHQILIIKDPHAQRYFWKVDKVASQKWYIDLDIAKSDIWDYMVQQQELDKW